MILGTAGHIDHGKTTLVRALTGVDTDRLPEEKRRGITIDLGFAPLTLDGIGVLGVVDVPGHEAFVRTMVAGAAGIDLAMLVIAADAGVMPQTREHLAILDLLGVSRGVVALTKSDLVDDDWLALVEDDVRAALHSSQLANAPIVRVSATTGDGLPSLKNALAATAKGSLQRDSNDLFRLPVDRVFTMKGTGTVVTGTVWSGSLERDEVLTLFPVGREVRVRGLQAHGESVSRVHAGERAAIALGGIELDDVHRGMWLTHGQGWFPSRVLRADVTLLAEVEKVPGPRQWLRLHLGTQEVGARIVSRDPLAAGKVGPVRIVVDEPMVARGGDRFVLRAASPAVTIGGGVITDPHAPPRAKPWPRSLASREVILGYLLDDAGANGLEVNSLPVRLGGGSAEVGEAIGALQPWVVGSRGIAKEHHAALAAQIRREVKAYHKTHPLDAGAPMQWLRSRLSVDEEIASAAIDELIATATLRSNQGLVADAAFASTLSGAQTALSTALLGTVRSAGKEPPTLDELSAMLKAPRAGIADVARFLAREGALVAVERDRYYSVEAVRSLRALLEAGMEVGRDYAPSELREILGFTRKFLIPFLEYCDREGYTIRGGLGRQIAALSEGQRVR
jgi:selenocysteine-specific elongation factor